MKSFLSIVFLACSGVLIAGCGGAGADFDPGRGEGSIPIGRAHASDSKSLQVQLRVGDSSYDLEPSASGTVYAPSSILVGPWSVQVSAEGGWAESVPEISPANSADVFDVTVLPANRHGDVTAVVLDYPNGIRLRVGETIKLKTSINGSNLNSLQASYWTNGGVGTINPGGVFKAKAAGLGSVTVDVLGFQSTVNVTVDP